MMYSFSSFSSLLYSSSTEMPAWSDRSWAGSVLETGASGTCREEGGFALRATGLALLAGGSPGAGAAGSASGIGAELAALGEPTTGLKGELVERLEQAMRARE